MNNATILSAISFIFFMALGFMFPVQSLYSEYLGASYTVIGLLGSLFSLAQIFFGYVWGDLSDHLGRRKPLLAGGLAASTVTLGLLSIAPDYGYLVPLLIIISAAQAAYMTTSLAMMGDLLEHNARDRGRKMGAYRGMGSLGFGLTAFITGSVADKFSIRAPFVLATLVMAVGFLLALALKEPAPNTGTKPSQEAESFWQLLLIYMRQATRTMARQFMALFKSRNNDEQSSRAEPESKRRPLVPLLISTFIWSVAFSAVFAVWSNYMVSELGYNQEYVGRLWAIAALTEAPFMILAGWLSDRVGRLPMLSVGFLSWTLVFVGYVFAPLAPWIVLTQVVRGFAYAAFTAAAMTYAAEVRARSQRGQASGLYNSANGLGSILGNSSGGAMAQHTGSRLMIAVNAVLMFAGAVYLATVAVRQKALSTNER